MARRTQQIERLAQVAQDRCEAAGKRLGRNLALLAESRARETVLERYRDEYRERFAAAGSRGMSPGEFGNYRGFLARLDQALAQQLAEVAALARGVEDARAQWLAARRSEQSFEILFDRAVSAARAREARRLQKMFDEICGRQAAANPTAPSAGPVPI